MLAKPIEGVTMIPVVTKIEVPAKPFRQKRTYNLKELLWIAGGWMGNGREGAFSRLPAPPMLMFDRITHISVKGGNYRKGRIKAEFDLTPDKWFFLCHFLSDPVMPGCLKLDALWQLTGLFMGWQGLPGLGRAVGVGEVKFSGMVQPTTKKITFHVHIKKLRKGAVKMVVADGFVEADGQVVSEIKDMKVVLFDPEREVIDPNDIVPTS